jgi:hypothetical protein
MCVLSCICRALKGFLIAITAAMLLVSPQALADRFEQLETKEITIQGEAVDLAVTSDGRWTFVLTNRGEVTVYNATGKMIQTIKVGRGYECLEYDGTGKRLFLSGSGQQKLKVITLTLRYEIDPEASPILGPRNTPVTLAVYTDFQ